MSKSIVIDEEGFVSMEGLRIEDADVGGPLLQSLRRIDKDCFVASWDGEDVLVEAFDEPLVAKHVERDGEQFVIQTPYGLRWPFKLADLCVDEWDRFHGQTAEKVAFVFSRSAQFEFFDLVDSYDDTGVTVGGKRIEIPPFFIPLPEMEDQKFWTNIYQTETPGWELGREAKPLVEVYAQLKLPRSRVLVLGCGTGQDAAFLAKQGHVVTAVDFSKEAIERARKQFGDEPGLKFVESDIFAFQPESQFDIIFEHACLAAIAPSRRQELINLWSKWLAPRGHLLGIFFMMSKRSGPPYGNSEWELRERLRKKFRFLYWTRWRHSLPNRQGRELVVYAQKV